MTFGRAKKPPALAEFMRERNAHMNAKMLRRGLELPDPFDLRPDDLELLPADYRRAVRDEVWAVMGANIAYMNDQHRARQRKVAQGLAGDGWEQGELPLAWPEPPIACASGWCAPSSYEYATLNADS